MRSRGAGLRFWVSGLARWLYEKREKEALCQAAEDCGERVTKDVRGGSGCPRRKKS